MTNFSAPDAPSLNLIDTRDPYSMVGPDPIPLAPGTPTPVSHVAGAMYASMGLSAISAITGAIMQSSAMRAAGDYQASIAATNAKIAGIQEKQALEAGDVEASRQNLKTQATIGAIKAAQGASGTDVASGSSAIVRSGVAGAGAIDELTIRNNAARRAWGFQTEALEDTFKGQFAQLTAKAQSTQSLITGGLQAISGPLGIESTYLRFARYMGGGGGSGVPFPNMST